MSKLINMEKFNLGGMSICLIVLMLSYYLVERSSQKLLDILGLKDVQLNLLLRKIIMVVISLVVYLLLDLEIQEIFNLSKWQLGLIWVAVGMGIAFFVAVLTFQIVIKTDHGQKYFLLLNRSPVWTLITMAIFVGPAEDIFFLGIIQNTLTLKIGWGAILVYMITFTLFHYLNVLAKIESKREFFGMLPVRLTISLVLAIAYYQTNSLIYSLIIHNIFDTINYLAMRMGVAKRTHLELKN